MSNKKTPVYTISKDGQKKYDVYSDGTAQDYSDVDDPFFDDFLETRLNDALETREITALRCGLFWNEKHRRAFIAVCILTEGSPEKNEAGETFNGFTVEYFGEGEPWTRAVPEGAVI